MDEYLESMEDDLKAALEALNRELSKVRTGRASPKLVDELQVQVQSYGATMPLNQLATVQAPDARLLVITPWDKSTIADIEKGILAAGLGLNPSSDGQVIRLPVPALTKERRQELQKMCRNAGEDSKVRMRHVRRDYNDIFKGAEKDGDISEDDSHRYLKQVQDLTDKYTAMCDTKVNAKEAEVLEV
ncbi:MAG: ribosome recycling factor [Alphaproteobacteria bacterium]|nr:ribosome recycling factor [Alphaproteobacteria bacterium]